MLEIGQRFSLHRAKVDGDRNGVHLPHDDIMDALRPGTAC